MDTTQSTRTDFFPNVGEMAERCRSFDWGNTALGPVDQWPQSLRNRHLQEPIFARVFSGETVNLKDAHYALNRSGTIEDAYFDASFVPVPLEDDDQIGGSLSTLFETTEKFKARADAVRGAAELSAVVGSIPEAVYIGTTAGFTMVNGGALPAEDLA